ncbi:MAG: hypothetical protein ACREMT_04895 [Vulcanimicrobiaceae bacterium]
MLNLSRTSSLRITVVLLAALPVGLAAACSSSSSGGSDYSGGRSSSSGGSHYSGDRGGSSQRQR